MGNDAGVMKEVVVDDKFKKTEDSETFLEAFVEATKFAPLIAAVWAPVSTLLDIPALSQPWYFLNGVEVKDPKASIILSGFSLGFNTLANALLVARFSAGEKIWRPATRLSVVCWLIKVIIALINLCIFGVSHRNAPGYTFTEGFWAAVMSVIIAGLINIALILHFFLQFDKPGTARDAAEIRVAGKNFMLSVMSLIALFALNALVFSRIEHWTYVDGIYFSLVTAFTIGFGDFYPTYNATRVLCFPYAVTAIALLAVQVGVIINFIGDRAESRKARWRAKFEQRYQHKIEESEQRQNSTENGGPQNGQPIALVQEIARLQEMQKKEEMASRMFDLATSIASLIVFWMVGAVIFMSTEGWEFGSSIYFCYVFFLTIGYGSDFAPISSAGRVVFIVYALMAVPVVTSFVVQTVSGILGAIADRAMEKTRDRVAPTESEEQTFHSHAHYVTKISGKLSNHYRLGDEFQEAERVESTQLELTRLILDLAIKLEGDARSLLLDSLPKGSKPHVLLRADRTLHLRALRASEEAAEEHDDSGGSSGGDEEKRGGASFARQKSPWLSKAEVPLDLLQDVEQTAKEERESELKRAASGQDTLEHVRRYRQTFAALLAAGSLLLEMKGEERRRFERRVKDEEQHDHGGFELGSGRTGPAEEAAGVDI